MDSRSLPKLPDLSLEEKVGQVLMVGFAGKDPAGARAAVRDLRVGGLIYFARNTGSVKQTAELSAALQDMAASFSGIPLLISVDQEGGIVSRLTDGLPLMPGPMSLGATADPDLVFAVSRALGVQIRAAGVNVNLAPDLDVNDNPFNPVIGVRSFGSDPALVETLGTASVRGLLAAGVAPVGKHFPGHGNTSIDSHLDLPVLPHPMERLSEVELRPFKAAIRAGMPAIMTAHIVFRAIDPNSPATLSEPVLEGLLRQKLGFQGVIMTDCLEMDAISKNPGTPRGAVLALKAGADMLLISHTLEYQKQAYLAILEAVESGVVPMSRLDEAVRRVLTLKKSLRVPNPLPPDEADTAEFRNLSRDAHLRSITVLRGGPDGGDALTPYLWSAGKKSRDHLSRPLRIAVASPSPANALVEALAADGITQAEGIEQTTGTVQAKGATQLSHETLAKLKDADAVILLTQNAWKSPEQACFAASVLAERPDAIVVATRDPYDLRVLPTARTFICTYSHRPEAMKALVQVLRGKASAQGKLHAVPE